MSSRRFGGFAGLAFVLTVLPVNIILGSTGMPRAGATRSEVLSYFAKNDLAVGLATALATIAWLALPMYAAGVVAAVRRHERESGDSWSLVGLAGTVMQNAIFASVVGFQATLGFASLSDDVAWGLWQAHNAMFTLNTASLAIVLFSLSIAGLRAGLLDRWHAKLGLTSAALLATSAALTPVELGGSPVALLGLAGFLLWIAWIVSVSLRLLRERVPAAVEA